MITTLLKLGLSGYDVNPRFCAFQCEYLLQNPLFFLGKNIGGPGHPYEKNELTVDHSGGCTVRPAGSYPIAIDHDFETKPLCDHFILII